MQTNELVRPGLERFNPGLPPLTGWRRWAAIIAAVLFVVGVLALLWLASLQASDHFVL